MCLCTADLVSLQSVEASAVWLTTTTDISSQYNFEFVMRMQVSRHASCASRLDISMRLLQTDIDNEDEFFTDLNGFQVVSTV